MKKQVCDDMEGKFNFCPDACLDDFELPTQASQTGFRQRFAQGAFHRHVLSHRTRQILDALLDAPAAGIGQYHRLGTM